MIVRSYDGKLALQCTEECNFNYSTQGFNYFLLLSRCHHLFFSLQTSVRLGSPPFITVALSSSRRGPARTRLVCSTAPLSLLATSWTAEVACGGKGKVSPVSLCLLSEQHKLTQEIPGGWAWLRASVDTTMFIKGLSSSVKFWYVFLVSELQPWLTSFPSHVCSPLLLHHPHYSQLFHWSAWDIFKPTSYTVNSLPLFNSHLSLPHIHLSSSFSLLRPACFTTLLSSLDSSSAHLCPTRVLMQTFLSPPPPSVLLPSIHSVMSHLILYLKAFVLAEALCF